MVTMTLYNGATSQGAYIVSVSSSGNKRYFTETNTGAGADRTFDRIDIDGDTTYLGPSKLPNGGFWPIGSKLTVYCEWWVDGEGDVISGYSFSVSIYDFVETKGISFNGVELPGCSIQSIQPINGAYSFDLRFYTTTFSNVSNLMALSGPVSKGVSVAGLQYVISPLAPGELYVPDLSTYTNCYISGISVEPFGAGYWVDLHIDQSAYAPVT